MKYKKYYKNILLAFVLILLGYLSVWLGIYNQCMFEKNKYEEVYAISSILEMGVERTEFEKTINIFKLIDKYREFKKDENVISLKIADYQNNIKIENEQLLFDIQKLEERYEKISKDPISVYEIDLNGNDAIELKKQRDELGGRLAEIKSKIGIIQSENKQIGEFSNGLWDKADSDLEIFLKEMSLSDKASQLLMFQAEGDFMSEDYSLKLEELSPGGVILMGSNISDRKNTEKFISKIQGTNYDIPLLVATDQEGGVVKRVSWDYTKGQKYWAKLSEDELCQIGKGRAGVLNKVGINLNFSPVVDLQHEGDAFINNRTISSDPEKVSGVVSQYIYCHENGKVSASLKHFPGHGQTVEDSHITLPEIDITKEEWLKNDAIPFIDNLESDFIMVGHLLYSKIDPDYPATQSRIWLTEILREELGYEGVLITDAMGQLHGSTGISVEDALKNSYNAGMDIVLYVSLPESEERIIQKLVQLIEDGEISEQRIDESLMRILKHKRDII